METATNRKEFAEALYWLAMACGQVRPDGKPRVSREQLECYYELLGDVPADALWAAVKQTAAEHEYGGLPPAGVIRRVAVDLFMPDQMTAAEGWEMVRAVAAKLSRYISAEESRQHKESLPDRVRRAAEWIGWTAIQEGDRDVVRSNFIKAWNEETERMRRSAMVPAGIAQQAAAVRARITAQGRTLRIERTDPCLSMSTRSNVPSVRSRSATQRRESA